jgi:triacylglycerol lipase
MSSPATSAPIVLVHGIFGFNRLGVPGFTIAQYFRNIPQALRDAGYNVPEPPNLIAAGSISERASDLKKYLETNPDVAGQKVHLVAHSMGGLDARYLISQLGMAERVRSLTTIGTPHHGSPIADLVVQAGEPLLSQLTDALGIDVRGLPDLTTDSCKQFNETVVDLAQVRYYSVAGRFEPARIPILGTPLGILGGTHDTIQAKEGDNDGLVSVASATFGQSSDDWNFLGIWEGSNHARVINWGTNILPSVAELADDSIIENYKALVAQVTA